MALRLEYIALTLLGFDAIKLRMNYININMFYK
jgi:hypothetical protein